MQGKEQELLKRQIKLDENVLDTCNCNPKVQ